MFSCEVEKMLAAMLLVLAVLSSKFNLGSLRDALIKMVIVQSTGFTIDSLQYSLNSSQIHLHLIMPIIADKMISRN